jgi:hypothetical protein
MDWAANGVTRAYRALRYGNRTIKKADQPGDAVQPVGLIGNEDGRCYRTRGGRRVIIIEGFYNCGPRGRYIERCGYHIRIEPDFNPTSTVIGERDVPL